MEAVRIILSGLWVALMLTYLLGDVLRIFSGDYVAGEMAGQPATQWMWLLAAIVLLIPIVMLFLTLIMKYPMNRWVNMLAAIFLILFNLAGLPYPSLYDNFLIVVGFGFNALTIWYAWRWV